MRRKKAILLSALPLLGLLSCSSASRGYFSFKDDASLPYFYRNGEVILRNNATSNDVSTVSRVSDAALLISRLKKGDDLFLYCHSTTCQYCRKIEAKFVSYCLDSSTEVFSLDLSDNYDEVTKLVEAYPSFSPMLKNLTTPSMFFLNESGETRLDIDTHLTTTDGFESFIGPLYNNTSIYRYTSYEAFSKGAENQGGLLYIDDGSEASSAFVNQAFAKAKHQDKVLSYVEWDNLSVDDKASFAALLGSASSIATYEKGGVVNSSYDYVSSFSQALSLAKDYYAI